MGDYVSTQSLVIHQWAGPSITAHLTPDVVSCNMCIVICNIHVHTMYAYAYCCITLFGVHVLSCMYYVNLHVFLILS